MKNKIALRGSRPRKLSSSPCNGNIASKQHSQQHTIPHIERVSRLRRGLQSARLQLHYTYLYKHALTALWKSRLSRSFSHMHFFIASRTLKATSGVSRGSERENHCECAWKIMNKSAAAEDNKTLCKCNFRARRSPSRLDRDCMLLLCRPLANRFIHSFRDAIFATRCVCACCIMNSWPASISRAWLSCSYNAAFCWLSLNWVAVAL